MAALPRRTIRVKPCASLAGILTECGAEKSRWSTFSTNSVDICLLSETFLNSGKAYQLANYVCHRTDRPSTGGGKAVPVRRDIVQHSVPVPGLNYLEATAIQVIMAGRPVKILAPYLSPSRSQIGADLTACFGAGLLVLLAGDLYAKHVD